MRKLLRRTWSVLPELDLIAFIFLLAAVLAVAALKVIELFSLTWGEP